MFSNFVIAINCILPVFLIMAVGIVIKKINLVDDHTLLQMNNLVFVFLLPLMIFNSIYNTDASNAFAKGLLWYLLCSVLIIFVLVTIFIIIIEKSPKKRGTMIQAIYRSNFLILGLPVVEAIFGSEKVGMTAVSVALMVPLFNVLAVIALEVFRHGKFQPGKILKGIATNPLIWGCVLGLFFLITGLRLPGIIETTCASLGKIGSPLALMILGASLHFDKINANKVSLTICVAGKLVIVPAIAIPAAIMLGFRDVELGTIMVAFASPTAVGSFAMAQLMDGDAELAGEAVVFSSAFSCITIILWTFLLKQLGFM